jgi:chromate transporter
VSEANPIPGAAVAPAPCLGALFRLWQRFHDSLWVKCIDGGKAPLIVGRVLPSGYLVTRGANDSAMAYAATALTIVVVLVTRVNPLWMIAAGAAAGLAGIL